MKQAFLIPALLFSITASAQKFMIHAGTALTHVKNTDRFGASPKNPRVTFTGSAGIQYVNFKMFSLSSSAGYMNDYFTLNTVLKIKYPKPATVNPFINLGVFAGTPLNNAGFKKFNPGAVAGIGLSTKVSKHDLGIEANYLPFFNKVFEGKSYEGPVSITERSVTITALFGF